MSRDERRKKRRALLLALFSTGLLTLFFLILVWSPPVEPPGASGYLLVEFGPGGQNLPPPPPPRPKETPAPRVTRPAPKAPSPPKPRTQPKPKPKARPVAEPKPKPAPAPRAESAPALPKAKAPPTPTAPEGPPLVPRAPEAPAPLEAAPAPPAPLATPEAPAPTEAAPPPPVPQAAPAPGVPGPAEAVAPGPPGPRGEAAGTPPAPFAPEGEGPVLPEPGPPAPEPLPRAAGPEPPALPPTPTLPGPAPPTPQPGPARGAALGKGAAHYTVRLATPLLVSVDNAPAAFPQRGFALARSIYEVPVEGGVTRLLFETRGGEEGLVGPVRSARLYMLDLVDALQAFLVHVGGSPLAQRRIEEGGYVTFDGLYDRARFVRTRDRRPPHNAYADLGKVRAELRRLGLDRARVQKGAAYLPPEDAPPGERVAVRFAPDYQSAFVYREGSYRWLRNQKPAAVRVDAVAVLHVKAGVRDEAGRLALELTQGEGALYLKGRYLPVRWRLAEGGFVLEDAGGEALDLTPYRVWFVLVPPWARVE